MSAPERIAAYLKRRREHRQTDYERIHGLDFGSDKACELLASDIEAVIAAIAAARAEGVREGMLKAAGIAAQETEAPPQYNIKAQWRADIGTEVAAAIRAAAEAQP